MKNIKSMKKAVVKSYKGLDDTLNVLIAHNAFDAAGFMDTIHKMSWKISRLEHLEDMAQNF